MFAIVLAALMVTALLAGCGSSTAETKAPETTAAPAPATEAAAPAAVSYTHLRAHET